jgi:hypothetical protein
MEIDKYTNRISYLQINRVSEGHPNRNTGYDLSQIDEINLVEGEFDSDSEPMDVVEAMQKYRGN